MKLLPRAIASALGNPSAAFAPRPGGLVTRERPTNTAARSEREPRAACSLGAGQKGGAVRNKGQVWEAFSGSLLRFPVKAAVGTGRREGP